MVFCAHVFRRRSGGGHGLFVAFIFKDRKFIEHWAILYLIVRKSSNETER